MHDPYWIGAQIACTVANSQRAKGKPYTIDDFYPRTQQVKGKGKPRQTPEEMLLAFEAATSGLR